MYNKFNTFLAQCLSGFGELSANIGKLPQGSQVNTYALKSKALANPFEPIKFTTDYAEVKELGAA